jgi:prepilin-type N-terminal cleavage/methylation domain-containing protein
MRGFTLAEVLITLGIIGVVAALTLPSLVASYKERETIVRLKKVYSVFSQAYQLAIHENDTANNWDLIASDSPQGAQNLMDILTPYLNFSKQCGNQPGCWPDGYLKRLDSNDQDINKRANSVKAVLADGTLVDIIIRSANCTSIRGTSKHLNEICAFLLVDVNGFKPPYQYSKDNFGFYLTKEAIIPIGTQDETTYPFSNCYTEGLGCTAWIIVNDNMDYLHCDDLTWDSKTKCK